MNEKSIAYCGLLCDLCNSNEECSCKSENHCGKRLSPQGCYQYTCCTEKGINGCWECEESPCGKDMLAPNKIKMRAFVKCIKEDGIDAFIRFIEENKKLVVIYHRTGVIGDYDLVNEDAVLQLLRRTK